MKESMIGFGILVLLVAAGAWFGGMYFGAEVEQCRNEAMCSESSDEHVEAVAWSESLPSVATYAGLAGGALLLVGLMVPAAGGQAPVEPGPKAPDAASRACTSCGGTNRPEAAHCTGCGRKLRHACPQCGASASADDAYCAACGSAVAAS